VERKRATHKDIMVGTQTKSVKIKYRVTVMVLDLNYHPLLPLTALPVLA